MENNHYGQGRPLGSKNNKTKRWEKFAQFLMEEGLDKFERELGKLDGKDYVRVVIDMMEYFRPKLRRMENPYIEETPLPIPILRSLHKINDNSVETG